MRFLMFLKWVSILPVACVCAVLALPAAGLLWWHDGWKLVGFLRHMLSDVMIRISEDFNHPEYEFHYGDEYDPDYDEGYLRAITLLAIVLVVVSCFAYWWTT